MTRDELIALAKEAGSSIVGGVDGNDTQCWTGDIAFGEDELEHFATLVAAKEREECADIAESFIVDNDFGERGGNEVASGIYDSIIARK